MKAWVWIDWVNQKKRASTFNLVKERVSKECFIFRGVSRECSLEENIDNQS